MLCALRLSFFLLSTSCIHAALLMPHFSEPGLQPPVSGLASLQGLKLVVPRRTSPDPLPAFVTSVYVAKDRKRDAYARVFNEEHDLDKFPYIVPITKTDFRQTYTELTEDQKQLLSDDEGNELHYLAVQGQPYALTATLRKGPSAALRREPWHWTRLKPGAECAPSRCALRI